VIVPSAHRPYVPDLHKVDSLEHCINLFVGLERILNVLLHFWMRTLTAALSNAIVASQVRRTSRIALIFLGLRSVTYAAGVGISAPLLFSPKETEGGEGVRMSPSGPTDNCTVLRTTQRTYRCKLGQRSVSPVRETIMKGGAQHGKTGACALCHNAWSIVSNCFLETFFQGNKNSHI
jgi:hypothetical protein